jgi:ribosome-binding protein aMBF1 (putative translation factor)
MLLILLMKYQNDILMEFIQSKYVHLSRRTGTVYGKGTRKLRQSRGVSMRKFALNIDMEYSQLSKIERGVSNPTISTASALAEGLEVHVRELFDFKAAGKIKK